MMPAATPNPNRHTLWLLLILAALRMALHLYANNQYGFHRDELALWDDAHRLAWGYVAYPPVTPALARVSLVLFGDSLPGFRMFSALAQCTSMLFAGLIAREFGGQRLAQVLATVAVAVTPFSLIASSMMMYVSFDYLWWVLLAWCVLKLINSSNPQWWLAIGATIGLGMLTKYTMLFCTAGLVVSILTSSLRQELRSSWLWGGIALSLLLFLPNAWWQWQHNFISLDFLQAIHARDVRIGRTDGFLIQQLYVGVSPLTVPLWLAGLVWLVFAKAALRWRMLVWLYIVPLGLFLLMRGRAYYLAPAYPMLLAAGAVAAERGLCSLREARPQLAQWSCVAGSTILLAAAVSGAVIALPLSPIDSAGWRISRSVHDNFAEQVGWPAYVAEVTAVYRSLPADERAHTAIFANNYGEAGAVNLYGPRYGLPRAISAVNSYWFLGYGKVAPTTVIVLGDTLEGVSDTPATCVLAGRVRIPHHVENEESGHPDIFVCRNFRVPTPKLWPSAPSFG